MTEEVTECSTIGDNIGNVSFMLRIHFIPQSRQLFPVEESIFQKTDKWKVSGGIERHKMPDIEHTTTTTVQIMFRRFVQALIYRNCFFLLLVFENKKITNKQ